MPDRGGVGQVDTNCPGGLLYGGVPESQRAVLAAVLEELGGDTSGSGSGSGSGGAEETQTLGDLALVCATGMACYSARAFVFARPLVPDLLCKWVSGLA